MEKKSVENLNYIAYTIGPVYDTILDSLGAKEHRTKRLQAGSRFFSEFMQTLLKNIKNDFSIIVPYVGEEKESKILDRRYKIGLFHDRFIAYSDKSKEEIKILFAKKERKTFEDMAKSIDMEVDIDTFMKNMDNNFIVASEEELKQRDSNLIFALNSILDSMELQRDIRMEIETNYISAYQDKHIINNKVKNLQTISGDFEYYAVIVADADKMGKLIKEKATKNPQNIKAISESLYHFFTDDNEKLFDITNNEYQGELIYGGGDDILAFLPVKSSHDKNFLDYIEFLDSYFKKCVGEQVSLSFGVNIVYQTYPLREAINTAFSLLHQAKDYEQNTLTIKTTKHSGQYFEVSLCMAKEEYKYFKDLITLVLKDKDALSHSLHHTLKGYQQAILATYQDGRDLSATFQTLFNDTQDKENLKKVQALFDILSPKTDEEFDKLFSALSIVKFLREDRKDG